MIEAKIGQLVEGKHNRYRVLNLITEKCNQTSSTNIWVLLRCVDFADAEDLGDQIFCKAVNEEIWIANVHFQHLKLVKKYKRR